MVVAGLMTATAAAKWILAGKILIAVGGGLVTVGPVLNQKVKSKKRQSA